MRGKKTRLLVKAALVGAIYAALTLIPPFSAISFGPVQFRLSEVLMFTALFSPAYAGGLLSDVCWPIFLVRETCLTSYLEALPRCFPV